MYCWPSNGSEPANEEVKFKYFGCVAVACYWNCSWIQYKPPERFPVTLETWENICLFTIILDGEAKKPDLTLDRIRIKIDSVVFYWVVLLLKNFSWSYSVLLHKAVSEHEESYQIIEILPILFVQWISIPNTCRNKGWLEHK